MYARIKVCCKHKKIYPLLVGDEMPVSREKARVPGPVVSECSVV